MCELCRLSACSVLLLLLAASGLFECGRLLAATRETEWPSSVLACKCAMTVLQSPAKRTQSQPHNLAFTKS